MLRNYIQEKKEKWDDDLDTCSFAYNTSKHESTKFTPFEIIFGRKAILPLDLDAGVHQGPCNEAEVTICSQETEIQQKESQHKALLEEVQKTLFLLRRNRRSSLIRNTQLKLKATFLWLKNEVQHWVPGLTTEDKKMITSGGWLSDQIVDAGQKLLKSTYPQGLQEVALEEKETFLSRFEAAKQLLAPGCKRNATISVLNTLLDRVLTQPENVQASSSRTSFSRNEMMLDSAGIYTGDEDASDQDLFVVERKTFKSLCSGLVQQCGCLSNPSWTIASFIKKEHVARVQFVCPHCKQSRVWASSRVLSGHYLANQNNASLKFGNDVNNMAKLVDSIQLALIGDSGVGKTCVVTRYADNQFKPPYEMTIGNDIKVKKILLNGKTIKLLIW
eukprot:Em0006g320a